MRFFSLEPTREKTSPSILVIIIVAIIAGLAFAGLIQGILKMIYVIILLAIKYWYWPLGFLGVILLIRKIFFRRKVQPVRIVR